MKRGSEKMEAHRIELRLKTLAFMRWKIEKDHIDLLRLRNAETTDDR
jgi:hypothetical protein